MTFARNQTRTFVRSLDTFIDNALNKANRINKPYKAIQKTDDFKKFQTVYQEGLADQGKWVAENLPELFASAGIADDGQPLALDQKQKLRGLMSRDMPRLSDYVSETKTFDLLRNFFEWSAVTQYKRWGYLAKADYLEFTLTNAQYIKALQDRAAYLLNKSSLDETTLDQVISLIEAGRLNAQTISEVAGQLSDQFDDISSSRADMLARTEAANSMGMANHATALENGAETKRWVAAGGAHDDMCADNEDAGEIPIDDAFPSGDMYEPAHPNCECYTEPGLIDLDSGELWSGD